MPWINAALHRLSEAQDPCIIISPRASQPQARDAAYMTDLPPSAGIQRVEQVAEEADEEKGSGSREGSNRWGQSVVGRCLYPCLSKLWFDFNLQDSTASVAAHKYDKRLRDARLAEDATAQNGNANGHSKQEDAADADEEQGEAAEGSAAGKKKKKKNKSASLIPLVPPFASNFIDFSIVLLD